MPCNRSCHNNGFYCEKQIEDIIVPIGDCSKGSDAYFCENFTMNTFGALQHKRLVHLNDLELQDMKYLGFSTDMLYVRLICGQIYSKVENELSGEKCCLPMNYRCDGTIECYNGEKSVS